MQFSQGLTTVGTARWPRSENALEKRNLNLQRENRTKLDWGWPYVLSASLLKPLKKKSKKKSTTNCNRGASVIIPWSRGSCQRSHQPQSRKRICHLDTSSNQGPYKVSIITAIKTSSDQCFLLIQEKSWKFSFQHWIPLIQYHVYRYYTQRKLIQRKLKCSNTELSSW